MFTQRLFKNILTSDIKPQLKFRMYKCVHYLTLSIRFILYKVELCNH